jgi:long-subunit acyl-CoA synthetase (AMP-forming)
MNNIFYVFEDAGTTYAQFGIEVARRARALPECRGEVVAIRAAHRPDFVINLFAVWSAGAVPFLVSTRVPWSTVADLLYAAQARLLVTDQLESVCPDSRLPYLQSISAECERATSEDPHSRECLRSPEIGAGVILHTSGTTGTPKLVRFSRASLLASLSFEESAWDGRWTHRDASLGWLPLYHAFGLISELLYAYRVNSRYYFSDPNPSSLLARLQHDPVTLFSSVPWVLKQIAELPGGLAALARLRWVVVGGAVISPELGEKLVSAGVRLVQQYGMTELGATFRGSPLGDWRDMFPVIPERYWEIEEATGQLTVRPDCPVFGELATRDTFDRSASGALRYRNRLDDVLVHINGEKSNALAIEQSLRARVGDAVEQLMVAGSGRRRPACLVLWKEGRPVAEDWDDLHQAIYAVNQELPRHSQLRHDLVLPLASSDRMRIPLSPKGTVNRRALQEVFRHDLDELYRQAEEWKPSDGTRLSAVKAFSSAN